MTAIEDTYTEERGYPPYHPRMMVTVLLYAYCTGTYSSRKIAARLEDSVAFRFLAAENQPDFRTISDFRKRHSAALAGLFTQVLRLCRQAGLVKLGRVAIDGTRIKANASKHKAMSYGRMAEQEAALQAGIAELLRRAEQVDRDEDARHGPDRRGDELPAELARRESRLQKIREAKAALEAEAREQAAQRGQGSRSGDAGPKAQRNFTDPESKIQKTGDGFIQGYNAQAAVDAHRAGDRGPGRDADGGGRGRSCCRWSRRSAGPCGSGRGRYWRMPGYCSEENLQTLERRDRAYIATGRQTHAEWPPRPRAGGRPANLTRRERMARKLRTVKGRAVYACRKAIVEPVFGQIKHARGFRQFLRRGCDAVRHEWALLCTVHNLLKLHTAGAWP